MNYRHVYHAGNFCDVIKHVTLIALLVSFQKKETPYCYIDTHAGSGLYDLFSTETSKTKEYLNGVEKIIQQDHPPTIVKYYLSCLHEINSRMSHQHYGSMQYYPGSPSIARHFARGKDRVVCCELQQDEYQKLKQLFLNDKQVAVHHVDGYHGLKAFLPPAEKRGIVLIDPPYEQLSEFEALTRSLPIALKRFMNGTYAIWYPIKEKKQTDRFQQAIRAAVDQPILAVDLTIYPDLANHLNGCGLLIVNPPFQLLETMQQLLPWIWKALTINDQGAFQATMLK